ncbi:MAG TPA: outer membrane beta-barrel protein, partial [Ferruginibacter sp.]|nr:outer membrane beta-barrel protein [Ferruginibacter sp.]
NFYHTESADKLNAITTGETGNLKNTSDRFTQSKNDKYSLNGNIIFKHKFNKLRRTVSLTADWSLLNTEGTNFMKSSNTIYDSLGNSYFIGADQMADYDKSTQKLTSKIVYTEPLSKKFSLETGYEISYNKGSNDLVNYNFSNLSGKYDQRIDSISNDFDQSILINKPSLKISYSDKKIKYNFGSGFGFTSFDLIDRTYDKSYKRNYTNFFPSASFNYTYKSNHNLRVNYNGNTTQPTINQLQPLRNSTDEFNQYIGNPDLKPSFSNNINLSHNSYDFIKDRWMYQSVNLNVISNSITNNRIIDVNTGKTISQPINTNGNVSLNLWTGIGLRAKKINTRFNFGPNLRYSKFADVINNKVSYSKTTTAGTNFSISKSKDKRYDISIWDDFSYSNNKNSQSTERNHFFINTSTLDATIYIDSVWSISSDYRYYFRQKTSALDDNLDNQLWNAKLQRTFRKNEFTVYVMVRDILNQNIGIDRSFYGNSYKEERNERLKRYFMVGFKWDFKNKNSQPK